MHDDLAWLWKGCFEVDGWMVEKKGEEKSTIMIYSSKKDQMNSASVDKNNIRS